MSSAIALVFGNTPYARGVIYFSKWEILYNQNQIGLKDGGIERGFHFFYFFTFLNWPSI
jgi:hypothetical protein